MTLAELREALHLLRAITQEDTEEFMTSGEYRIFHLHPCAYFQRCDYDTQVQLWEIIQPRLAAAFRRSELVAGKE